MKLEIKQIIFIIIITFFIPWLLSILIPTIFNFDISVIMTLIIINVVYILGIYIRK